MAKIALIVGSVRHDRQGIKVARWMEQNLIDRNHVVFFIDPIEINLPLLDRMYKEMTNPSEKLIIFMKKSKLQKDICLLLQNITIVLLLH